MDVAGPSLVAGAGDRAGLSGGAGLMDGVGATDRDGPGREAGEMDVSGPSDGYPLTGKKAFAKKLLGKLSPYPKAERRKRSRKTEKSAVLTSSPSKEKLLASYLKKAKGAKPRHLKKKKSVPDSEQDTKCLICSMQFVLSSEEWIKCGACNGWACVPCTDANDAQQAYICDHCRE